MLRHDAHDHPGSSTVNGSELALPLFEGLVLLALLAAAAAYAVALWASRNRSPWPHWRTAAWLAGLVAAAMSLLGPLADAAHVSFTAHMVGHLLLGMLAPLLLVLGAPVTLLLRALTVENARSLTRLLGHPVIRLVAHPVVAAALNIGGLWVLYTTPLFGLMHESPLAHAAVHAHVILTGCLFTEAMVGTAPNPHRASITVRSAVLIAFIALHSILAKWLWAHPPAGVDVVDARTGAQVMYYGGDAIDVVLIVLLLGGWYRATRDRDRSATTAIRARWRHV
ncbi:cytochrome c oxidase assembly protein [Microbacterium sp. 3J1]|uniref:cytochrome c oxidase assembly protein n=1 Tax=Microbacterium sp. 3J1 TaxID=861269 RepID=UPI000AF0D902|nr:cytochrome c oxidase assembly protein [Microbacterium sp. 3J1]